MKRLLDSKIAVEQSQETYKASQRRAAYVLLPLLQGCTVPWWPSSQYSLQDKLKTTIGPCARLLGL